MTEEATQLVNAAQAATQSAIVCLEFGMPRQSRELATEATEIEIKNKAQKGTVKRPGIYYFRKRALDEKGKEVVIDGLDPLRKFQTRMRAATILTFAPYPYAGAFYLLPGPNIPKYQEAVTKYLDEKQNVWTAWADDVYPEYLATAKERMGDLYDSKDFPSLGECAKRFTCADTLTLLAEGDQWKRIAALTPDIVATMEEKSQEKIAHAVASATASLWSDVLKPIQHIVDTFSKDKFKIHDSMIANVLNIVEMVPALNLERDPNLAALAAEAKETLGKIKPEDLRKSAEVRAAALNTAKNLVTAFAPLARKLNI